MKKMVDLMKKNWVMNSQGFSSLFIGMELLFLLCPPAYTSLQKTFTFQWLNTRKILFLAHALCPK